MAEFDAPVFKLGQWAVMRFGGITGKRRVGERCRVAQKRLGAEHFQNLLGVGLPVGGAVQVAAGLQARGQFGNQTGLNQAALVVFFLVPGVGEENVHTVQATWRQHVVYDLHGVVRHDANVVQVLLAYALEQGAHAGLMHFAANKVFLRHQARNMGGGLAHAKADFQNGGAGGCGGPGCRKTGGVIEQAGLVRLQKLRPQVFKRLGLPGGGAAGAAHKTFNGLGVGHVVGCRMAGADAARLAGLRCAGAGRIQLGDRRCGMGFRFCIVHGTGL